MPNADLIANALTAIGVIVTGSGIFFAANQYKKDQLWKRKEYVSNKYKEIKSDRKCRLALNMLDASENNFRLDSDNVSEKTTQFYVSHWTIAVAFIPTNSEFYPGWDDRFGFVRKCFDSLFDHFEILEDMRNAGLFSAEELRVYLGYWAKAIQDNRFNKKLSRNLILYMYRYNYLGSINLIRSMGYSIGEENKYLEILREECKNKYWIDKVYQKKNEKRF